MKVDQWHIEQGCPQCGAPVTFTETDRLLACPFCRTRLALVADGPFRYCFSPASGDGDDLLYLPYRRFRGACYSVRAGGPDYRLIDATRLACRLQGAPATLGLRPQALKLRFATPDMAGRFLAPDLPAEAGLPEGKGLPSGVFFRAFLGDAVSLIHSPCRIRDGFLYDAILDRRLCPCPVECLAEVQGPAVSGGNARFVPALCPHCGWDLEGEKDSLVLLCRNCDSAWGCDGQSLAPVPYAILKPAAAEEKISVYLPFWRMTPQIEGLPLCSYADLIRLANLPRVATPASARQPFLIWSPAFKVHPALYLRWARQLTVFHPAGSEHGRLPRQPLYPVTLPLSEAREGMAITLAGLINDKRRLYPALPHLQITLRDFRLEFHPFLRDRNELLHAHLRVALEATALAYGNRL